MTYLQNKKLTFMSIVNRIKGFVRSVSGIPPLSLSDCVDNDSLISYTIRGNTVQNGTPTPDNPVEVESVGEKTKNLFNELTDIVRKYDGDNTVNGYECYKIYDYSANCGYDTDGRGVYGRAVFEISTDLKANKTYTVSAKFLRGYNANGSTTNDAYQARIACKYADGTYMTSSNESFFAYGTAHSTTTPKQGAWTITPTKDITRMQIQYYLSGNSYCWMLKNSIQIEENSSQTTYEPYGYKIPVKCSGKNLFDSSKYWNIHATDVADGYGGYNVTKIDGGVKIARNSSAGWSNDIVGLEPNTTYTVSFKAKTAQGGTNYIVISVDKKLYYKYMYAATTSTLTQTFTTDGSPSAFGFAHSNSTLSSGTASTLEITDIMLVKGSTVTDYEPYVKPVTTNIYLDKPLAEGETLKNPVKLPTVKGTTIYTIGTGVQPKNMSATYYSTRKD